MDANVKLCGSFQCLKVSFEGCLCSVLNAFVLCVQMCLEIIANFKETSKLNF